ncbi:Uncharacterized protein Fot_30545 [Forsythia ovata]|uniref:Uncharacterized protein n=1 Tax=Forsythia ovata TaxID=205694 RepID=A0ABD1TV36_9LAMI
MEVEDETDEEDLQAKTSLRARSSKFTPKDQINSMGFDDDLMEIKSRLIRESSELDPISIVGMGGLEHWRVNSVHCPSLQRLALTDCEYLEEISSRNGEIPTLVPIKLYDCRNSLVTSANLFAVVHSNVLDGGAWMEAWHGPVPVHKRFDESTKASLSVRSARTHIRVELLDACHGVSFKLLTNLPLNTMKEGLFIHKSSETSKSFHYFKQNFGSV